MRGGTERGDFGSDIWMLRLESAAHWALNVLDLVACQGFCVKTGLVAVLFPTPSL